MTATLAAMLVAEGKIAWTTTVAEAFPEFQADPGWRQVTILQLLSNTAGAPGDFPPLLWSETVAKREEPEAMQREDLVRATLAVPPAYPPGTERVYSNQGFTIAAAMLEKAAGESYSELLEDRLFKPLGMDSAGFGAAATPGEIDQPYGHVRRLLWLSPIPPGPDADNPPAISPAGRVHLSILDFATYANFHLGSSGKSLLEPATLNFLHTPVPPGEDYALGWVTLEREWAGGRALYHDGSNTMNYAVMWLAPEKGFAAVAACNIGEPDGPKACDAAVSFLIGRFLEDR